MALATEREPITAQLRIISNDIALKKIDVTGVRMEYPEHARNSVEKMIAALETHRCGVQTLRARSSTMTDDSWSLLGAGLAATTTLRRVIILRDAPFPPTGVQDLIVGLYAGAKPRRTFSFVDTAKGLSITEIRPPSSADPSDMLRMVARLYKDF